MIELLITTDEINLGMTKARSELKDFIDSTKENILRDKKPKDIENIVKDTLDLFISGYYALSDKLSKSNYLSKEKEQSTIIYAYSLSCVSTLCLNYLERRIGKEFSIDMSLYNSLDFINPDNITGKSRFTTLTNSLLALRNYIAMSNFQGNIIYKMALYFLNLETVGAYVAKIECSEEGFDNVLSQIKPIISSDKLSFSKKSRRQNNQNLSEQNNKKLRGEKILEADELPETLPEYQINSASIDKVVGNDKEINIMLNWIYAMMHYDPKTKKNFLWMNGHGFPEGVLLYGNPGVGKTFTANAVMNHAIKISNLFNLELIPSVINGHEIASVYKNRSAALLEHYLSLMRKGDKQYLVLIDEFDDLVPLGKDGKLSDDSRERLSAFKRCIGNHSSLGNYFIIAIANRISDKEDIPIELIDRLRPLYIPGPKTAKEYGLLIKNGFEIKEMLGLTENINWDNVGEYLLQWKLKLEMLNDKEINIGRGYKAIIENLAITTKKPLASYLSKTLGKSPSQHEQFYKNEFQSFSEQDLYNQIDLVMNEMINARNFKMI